MEHVYNPFATYPSFADERRREVYTEHTPSVGDMRLPSWVYTEHSASVGDMRLPSWVYTEHSASSNGTEPWRRPF